jgi:hypothetical protein
VVQLLDGRDVDLASDRHDRAAMEEAFRYQQSWRSRRLRRIDTPQRQAGTLRHLASLVDEWRVVCKGCHRCFHRGEQPR